MEALQVLGKLKSASAAGDTVGLLDVGTSKVVCLIVRYMPSSDDALSGMRDACMLGIGHQRSRGLKAGVVVDLDEAEQAIRTAVNQAERMAGVRLENIQLAVACGRLSSSTFVADARAEGRVVNAGDVSRLVAAARAFAERDGRVLVHINRIGFSLDGAGGISDPCGMSGTSLRAEFHAVTADDAPLRNLVLAVERCYLSVAGIVPAPFASALAATTAEERSLGVLSIDIGAGVSTLALFAEGHLLWVEVVPVGGQHITFDLARALSAPLAEAERIKTLYGTLLEAKSDEQEFISYPLAGEEEPILCQASKAHIRGIIEPRMRALLGLIGERIDGHVLARHALDRAVLTGGTSQLTGVGEFAASVLGRPVRIGRPAGIGGMPANIASPAFSTVLGLSSAMAGLGSGLLARADGHVHASGYFGRVGRWLRESF